MGRRRRLPSARYTILGASADGVRDLKYLVAYALKVSGIAGAGLDVITG